MITYIEMNGTIRGAVEEFHLCTNLHKNDALFAECIRSFPHVTVDAQKWLHRLEMEIERVAEMQVNAMVPPAKKPQSRSRKTIPHMDIYGWNPRLVLFFGGAAGALLLLGRRLHHSPVPLSD
jgi:hypothetical protein